MRHYVDPQTLAEAVNKSTTEALPSIQAVKRKPQSARWKRNIADSSETLLGTQANTFSNRNIITQTHVTT